MTRIEIFRKNGSIFGYRAIGHSGYSEQGSDIVCAAISTALQMTLISLQEVLKLKPHVEIDEEGMMLVKLTEQDIKTCKEVYIVLDAMYIFLKELSKQYPKNIKLVEKEEK